MRLLIKGMGTLGNVAHIADVQGNQLCKTGIKLSDWKLQERPTEGILICYHCKRILAKMNAPEKQQRLRNLP